MNERPLHEPHWSHGNADVTGQQIRPWCVCGWKADRCQTNTLDGVGLYNGHLADHETDYRLGP